ncbi:hypothetical protein BJX99DRAFT_93187 [Aspergillus californicus]
MAALFGISVGDFITIGKLIYDIIGALSERGGAADDYQSLVSNLRSLYTCINAIQGVMQDIVKNGSAFLSPGPQLREQAIINGIFYELNCCRELLDGFLDTSVQYTTSLLPSDKSKGFWKTQMPIHVGGQAESRWKRLEKHWTKISWVVFRKEDVGGLERDLHGHLVALQLYQNFLQQWVLFLIEYSLS